MSKRRPKKRDYRAEYKRRIERALEQGYSRRVARGHAYKKPQTKWTTVLGEDGKPVRKRGKRRKPIRPDELSIKHVKFLEAMGVRAKPGQDFREIVRKDGRHVFGKVPKRQKDDSQPELYEMRLAELQKRDGAFDWTNEAAFIAQMKAAGETEQDAYTLWFSP